MRSYIFQIILIVVVCVLGYLLWKSYREKTSLKIMTIQNNIAMKDSLRELNNEWVTKYAVVQDLTKDRDSILFAREKEIKAKNGIIIRLNSIIGGGKGIEIDTVFVDLNDSKMLYFDNQIPEINPFVSYRLWVTDGMIPKHRIEMDFTPFAITTYLTRNKEGIWSGYANVDKKFAKLIKIKKMSVVINKDDYLETVVKESFNLTFIPTIGNIVFDDAYFTVGAGLLINDYFLNFSTAINSKYFSVNLGYNINLIGD